MAASRSRIVLFPYGQPPEVAQRESCAEFYLSLGGDVTRVIDGPFASIDRFVRCASTITDICGDAEPPIVVLCRTNPLAITVVEARRQIVRAIPALATATWVVFVDLLRDPFFARAARAQGALAHGPCGLQWVDPDALVYLVAGIQTVESESPPSRSMERMRTRPSDPRYARVVEQSRCTGSDDEVAGRKRR